MANNSWNEPNGGHWRAPSVQVHRKTKNPNVLPTKWSNQILQWIKLKYAKPTLSSLLLEEKDRQREMKRKDLNPQSMWGWTV